jgi:hypothetical protein
MKERTMKVKTFEIINHGWDHNQYFQGCGVAFTPFTHVVTGCGITAKEAYEDAIDQIASEFDTDVLPSRPRGIRARDKVPASHLKEDSEVWWYVSIRFTVE